MKNIKELYQTVVEMMNQGTDLMFLTIVASSGSAPRKTGAKMIVLPDGTTHGTVGGGNIEYTACKDALLLLEEKHSCRKTYTLRPNEAADLGMICGGEVIIAFQYVTHTDHAFLEMCEDFLHGWDENRNGTVYIFGGGHVAQELVPLLNHLDFRCIVFDDRSEFANESVFPDAAKCIVGDFEHLSDYIKIKSGDYVCIMTRGHLSDYAVQKQILHTPASYIGIMGSHRKTLTLRAKLLTDGFVESELDRCKSPIGLPIHAETPAEIAISIAGELIAHRASFTLTKDFIA